MINKTIVLVISLLFSCQFVFGQDWVTTYQKAQQDYSAESYESALLSAQSCLKNYQNQDGTFNGNYESILRLLTNINFALGNYEEGLEYCNKELTVKESTGNLNNLEHANALFNKGSLELNLNESEAALGSFEKVSAIYEQFYAADNSIMLDCQWKIADCHYQLNSNEKAFEILNRTIPTYDASEGLTMNYIQAMFTYSNLLMDINKYEEAYAYILDLQDIYDQFGPGAEYELALLNTNEGLCLNKSGKFTEAESAYSKADTFFGTADAKDSKSYFNMVNLRAVNLEILGEKDKAAELLVLIGAEGDVSSKSIALSNEAMLEFQEGKLEDAETSFNKVLELQDKEANPANYIQTSLDLANVKLALNKLVEVESTLTEVAPMLALIPQEKSIEAKYHFIKGEYEEASGNWSSALESYNSSLSILNATGDKGVLYFNVLGALAINYQESGNYFEAEKYFKQQLDLMIMNGQNQTQSYAITLNNLGIVKQNQAEFLDAQNYLEEARKITASIQGTESSEYAGIIENLGLALTQLGNYSKAEEYINRSIEIRKNKVGTEHPSYANSLQNLGRIKQFKGLYQEAEPLFSEALALKKKAYGTTHPIYADALNSSALLYQTMGNFQKAEPLFIESSNIFKNTYGTNHPDYATALENLATLYKLEGKNEKALQLLENALEIDKAVYGEKHPRYATTLHNLASIYKDFNELEKSKSLYQQALSIDRAVYGEKHPAYANTLYNLASLQQQLNQFDEAETNFKEALVIRKEILGENHPDYAFALYGLAGLYHATQKLVEAKPYYDEVIINYLQQITDFFPSLSENEKGAFYAKIKPVIESYQDYCVEYAYSGNTDAKEAIGKLFNLQLRTKALLLHSSNKVRNRIFSSGNQDLVDKYLSWTELKERLSKYLAYSEDELIDQGINISDLSQEINSLEKSLSQSSELFAEDVEQKDFTWQNVRDALKENQAALEIIRIKKRFVKDSVIYASLIVKKSNTEAPDMIILKDGEKLENRFFNYYRNAIKFTGGEDHISYEQFWNPINDYLSDINQVYASTDGIYNKININTLWNTGKSKYVIDDYIVRNISNTKEILLTDSTEEIATNSAEVFGFPDFNLAIEDQIDESLSQTRASEFGFSDIIPELPGTRDEVNKLNELLNENSWQANLYLRDNANEMNVKSIAPPRVLHIATHGFFKSDVVFEDGTDYQSGYSNAEINPLFRSGLLLAGSAQTVNTSNNFNEEDGVLTAYEAMNLNLDNTELVVLSACETGIGEVKNGEGVYGLQRSFMVAGAKAVIMSLWQVDDNTTQQLMVNFYRNWLSGINKFEAFKNAQLELKDKYADPFHWGAFIIIGTD